MSRIVFAWELGGGYGHIAKLTLLAPIFRARGHDVSMIVKDVRRTRKFLCRNGFEIETAPPGCHLRTNASAVSYAEVLGRVGYFDAGILAQLTNAWRGLFERARPDLVIGDYSPTALLAARIEGLPSASIGTGFSLPPRTEPMPTTQPWRAVPPDRMRHAERLVVSSVNDVLARARSPKISSVGELLDVGADFLCTAAELDHYHCRGPATYLGPIETLHRSDLRPSWPKIKGERVFVYLPADSPGLRALLGALNERGSATLAHVADSGVLLGGLQGDRLSVSSGPVDLEAAMRQCDLVVCHGGHGMAASALLADRPLLLVPETVEQVMLAYRLVRQGVALMAKPSFGKPEFARVLSRLLSDGAFAERARTTARQVSNGTPTRPVDTIVARCEQLLT